MDLPGSDLDEEKEGLPEAVDFLRSLPKNERKPPEVDSASDVLGLRILERDSESVERGMGSLDASLSNGDMGREWREVAVDWAGEGARGGGFREEVGDVRGCGLRMLESGGRRLGL